MKSVVESYLIDCRRARPVMKMRHDWSSSWSLVNDTQKRRLINWSRSELGSAAAATTTTTSDVDVRQSNKTSADKRGTRKCLERERAIDEAEVERKVYENQKIIRTATGRNTERAGCTADTNTSRRGDWYARTTAADDPVHYTTVRPFILSLSLSLLGLERARIYIYIGVGHTAATLFV